MDGIEADDVLECEPGDLHRLAMGDPRATDWSSRTLAISPPSGAVC